MDQCFKGQSAHAYNRNVAFRLGMFHVGWMGAMRSDEFQVLTLSLSSYCCYNTCSFC